MLPTAWTMSAIEAAVFVTIVLGFYLGEAFLRTGNLLTVMVTHAVYDLVLMAYLLRYHSPGGPAVNPIFEVDSDEEIDDYHNL